MDEFHKIPNDKDFDTFSNITETAYLTNITGPSREASEAIDSYTGVQHSTAQSHYNSFDNILPGQSARMEFGRNDYEEFRPSEAIPKKYQDIIKTIDSIYGSLAIVRNMIDLMSDFASEGIEIVHPVPYVENFYKEWFKKVQGVDRSERFLSAIYRHGMVVIRKYHGQLSKKQRKNLEEYSAATDNVKLEKKNVLKYNIPLKYVFYNPGYFEHKNYHEVNAKPKYILKIPKQIFSEDIFNNAFQQHNKVEIDSSRLYVDYYKKDDWKPKPTPFLFPIIKHAIMMEKLSLADSSALDGAISKIRVFKLGSLADPKNPIYPSSTTVSKLDQILRSNVSGGTIDIIWGPDIEILETNSDIHNFLGKEKYVPHLTQIYEGLGIPSSFVGSGQGTTNNYISLKILMRRLMSGRSRLIDFWEEQIKEVQMAMGFSEPATLEFNNLELGDEESERNLLVQLLDRDIVSTERALKVLGYDPRIENKRVMKENKQRDSGRRPNKAGQYHNAEKEFTIEKVAVERGWWAPEHTGILKAPGTEDVESPNDARMNAVQQKKNTDNINNSPKGGPGGRPPGAKDKQKRKTPAFAPKIKAALNVWVEDAQSNIEDILKPHILNSLGKKDYRAMTSEETDNYELLKFGVLSNMEPFSNISEEVVINSLSKSIDSNLLQNFNDLYTDTIQITNKKVSLSNLRSIQRTSYVDWLEKNRQESGESE